MEDIAICLDILEQKNWDLMVSCVCLVHLRRCALWLLGSVSRSDATGRFRTFVIQWPLSWQVSDLRCPSLHSKIWAEVWVHVMEPAFERMPAWTYSAMGCVILFRLLQQSACQSSRLCGLNEWCRYNRDSEPAKTWATTVSDTVIALKADLTPLFSSPTVSVSSTEQSLPLCSLGVYFGERLLRLDLPLDTTLSEVCTS